MEALSANPSQPVDENEFIDASRLVYDGIRDIRKAVLMIRVSCTVLFLFACFFFFLFFKSNLLFLMQSKASYCHLFFSFKL